MAILQTYNGYPLWRYIPSLPASVVFAVIFGILTGGHFYRMIRHRMWFCIPFVVGGLCKYSSGDIMLAAGANISLHSRDCGIHWEGNGP
jgi:hypothetical protein